MSPLIEKNSYLLKLLLVLLVVIRKTHVQKERQRHQLVYFPNTGSGWSYASTWEHNLGLPGG